VDVPLSQWCLGRPLAMSACHYSLHCCWAEKCWNQTLVGAPKLGVHRHACGFAAYLPDGVVGREHCQSSTADSCCTRAPHTALQQQQQRQQLTWHSLAMLSVECLHAALCRWTCKSRP
jgi:hypothetical protein